MELRLNDDGSLDEVVAKGCDFHLEQMANDHWWMCVTMPDGQMVNVWLQSSRKITAYFEQSATHKAT